MSEEGYMQDLNLSDEKKSKEVKDILNCLLLNNDTIERIRDVFKSEMELALNMKPSSLQMENTYIPELPDDKVSGVYLAMDLGGTNLRVLLLSLNNGIILYEPVHSYVIPDKLRIGDGNALFDFLATCIDDFAKQYNLKDDVMYPLGFTFSFPMRQNGLNSGILVTWTKSFNCPSIVGQDAAQILRQSLKKCGRNNIDVIAILNDTTGTLMHGAFIDKRTRVGIILGTGSNACYVELADRVKHWEQQRHGEKHVVIDVEWGAFGDNGVLDFIKTDFDKAVDNASLLANSFTFEKYIGGKYLGEICRVILQELHRQKLFLCNLHYESFPVAWSFDTDNISLIESDTIENKETNVNHILNTKFKSSGSHTADDSKILQYICTLVSLRAAVLVAINTAVLINRMDKENIITVAIDGSLYKHHPRLQNWLADLTSKWAPSKQIKFILAQDGSGKGACMVAAIAKKLQNDK